MNDPLSLARRLVELLLEDLERLYAASIVTTTFATFEKKLKALAAAERLVRELEG